MDTQSNIQQEKAKANSKWATIKDAVQDNEQKVTEKSQDMAAKGHKTFDEAHDQVSGALKTGGKFARSLQVLTWAQACEVRPGLVELQARSAPNQPRRGRAWFTRSTRAAV